MSSTTMFVFAKASEVSLTAQSPSGENEETEVKIPTSPELEGESKNPQDPQEVVSESEAMVLEHCIPLQDCEPISQRAGQEKKVTLQWPKAVPQYDLVKRRNWTHGLLPLWHHDKLAHACSQCGRTPPYILHT